MTRSPNATPKATSRQPLPVRSRGTSRRASARRACSTKDPDGRTWRRIADGGRSSTNIRSLEAERDLVGEEAAWPRKGGPARSDVNEFDDVVSHVQRVRRHAGARAQRE